MIPNNIKIVIFDFDGLLVDTEAVKVKTARQIMSQRGITLDEEDETKAYGLKDDRYYDLLIQKYALHETPAALLEAHNTVYDALILRIEEPLPGVRGVLDKCERIRLPAVVCSGSFRYQIKGVLGNLDLLRYFSFIASCEDTVRHKPHPDPYFHVLRSLGHSSDSAIAFEDSRNGVLSAKAAGIFVVGVQVGNHWTQNLSLADYVIQSFTELI